MTLDYAIRPGFLFPLVPHVREDLKISAPTRDPVFLSRGFDQKVVKQRTTTQGQTFNMPQVRDDVNLCLATRFLSSAAPHCTEIVLKVSRTCQKIMRFVNSACQLGKIIRVVRNVGKPCATNRLTGLFWDITDMPHSKRR